MGSGLMRGVGTMLNPAEMLKLRNLVGPGAWAAMGAFEAGAIGYDTINNNTPLNEALSDNWVTGWAMPWTKKEAQIKNLGEENISGSPAMQKYMEEVKLMADYERQDGVLRELKTRYGDQERAKVLYENQQGRIDSILGKWNNLQKTATVERDGEMVPVTGGEVEFRKAVSDMEEKRGAGEYIEEDYRFGNMGINKEGKVVDVNEVGSADVGDSAFKWLPFIGDKFKKGNDPMFETTGIQPIFDLPPSQIAKATSTKQEDLIRPLKEKYGTSPLKGYHEIKRPLNLKGATTTPLNADQLQGEAAYLRDIGILEPRGGMPQWYTDELQLREKWRQLFGQSPTGLFGSKLADGGRAGYMGGGIASILKPSEIPPERGGLRSIMINDKKY